MKIFAERVLIPQKEIKKANNFLKDKILRKSGKFYILNLNKDEIEKLKQQGIKVIIEKKGIRKSTIPNDKYFYNQWWVEDVKLDEVWSKNTDCSNIIVAVVDTGVDYNHIDLKSNIYKNPNEICGNGIDDDKNGFVDDCYGYDFANNDNDPMDDDSESHGTHVAGTIGAIGNNGIGIAGVCWKIKILPVKVLDKNGDGYFSDVADGIKYAVNMGADIINLSLETNYIDDEGLAFLEDAIKYAYEHNVIITSAAGNQSKNLDTNNVYPASFRKEFPNVIVTASLDKNGNLSTFTDYGYQTVDVGIPGENIYSTMRNNTYGFQSGSSMANAITTGLVAQILALYHNKNYNFIRAKLIDMAKSLNVNLATVSSGYPDFSKIIYTLNSPLIFSIGFPANSNYMDIFGYNLENVKFEVNGSQLNPVFKSKYMATLPVNSSSFTINASNDEEKSNPIKVNVFFEEDNCLDFNYINYLSDGWNLIGTNCDITDFSIFSNTNSVWTWINGKWYVYSPKEEIENLIKKYNIPSPKIILHKQGIWVDK